MKRISLLGIFLIIFGSFLLLTKLNIILWNWNTIFWLSLCVTSFVGIVQAFVIRNKKVVFWWSLLFFTSLIIVTNRLSLLEFEFYNFLATVSLVLGFSFLTLFLYEPKRITSLLLFITLGSYGIFYYLWWWDIISWFDFRYYARTYWPVLLIILGLILILQQKRRKSQ